MSTAFGDPSPEAQPRRDEQLEQLRRGFIDVEVALSPAEAEDSVIAGRNGYFKLAVLRVWGSDAAIWIEGIGRQGATVRGGFCIARPTILDELCRRWLDARAAIALWRMTVALAEAAEAASPPVELREGGFYVFE